MTPKGLGTTWYPVVPGTELNDLVPGSRPEGTGEPGTRNKSRSLDLVPKKKNGYRVAAGESVNVRGNTNDPNRGNWCTPKWLAELIGPVDLDPCSNPRSHVQAKRRLMLANGDDGLAPDWLYSPLVVNGPRVFINPPYARGSVLRWYDAYKHTRWCFLLRFDPSTEWFDAVYSAAELIAVPRGRRVNFEPPPGVAASSNAIAHALYYRHAADVPPSVVRACVTWRKKNRG